MEQAPDLGQKRIGNAFLGNFEDFRIRFLTVARV